MKDEKHLFFRSACMTAMIIVLVLAAVCAAWVLQGCKPTEKIVYQTHHDSVYVQRVDTFIRERVVTARDTVRLLDSVFIERTSTVTLNEDGDTVFVDRIIWRDRWHDSHSGHSLTDADAVKDKSESAIAQTKTDTIYINKTVEKQPSLKERVTDAGGWVAFVALLFVGVIAYIRTRK